MNSRNIKDFNIKDINRYSRRNSLKFRLTVITVLLIFLPMFIATLYNIYNFSNNAKRDLFNTLDSQNISLKSLIDIEIGKIDKIAENIAEDTAVSVTLQFQIDSQLTEYIKQIKEKNNNIDNLIIYNIESDRFLGNAIDNNIKDIINDSQNKTDLVTGFMDIDGFSIISIKPVITNNKVIGLVYIRSSIENNPQLLKEIGKKLKINIGLFREGEVVLLVNEKGGLKKIERNREIIVPDEFNNRDIFHLNKSVKLDNENYFLLLNRIKSQYSSESIGFIGILKESIELEISISNIRRNMLFIALGGIIIAVFLSVLTLNYLLKPLGQLIDTLESVRKGDFNTRFTIENYDEIGLVGNYLNNTVEKIGMMITELDQANEELQTVDRVKDEFLANTSHELRTPLNGIIGISESLIDGAAGKLPIEAINNLELITMSGKRLTSLINDILDYSKLENSDLKLLKTTTDIYSIVNIVLMINKPLAEAKGLYLVNNIPKEYPLVIADENRIEQVLHNLVGNAIKFTEEGGVTISIRSLGELAEIEVKDTGIGIPGDKLSYIFEKFKQVDGSISRERGGTGIGLAVSKELVELHGGQINVNSVFGTGSSFLFTIPLADTLSSNEITDIKIDCELITEKKIVEKSINSFSSDNLSLNGINILIVDDEPLNLKILENHLSLKEMNVYKANNGFEALELIRKSTSKFSLVILDIMMPRMSGYEVCREIRKNYSQIELPIMLLSAKNFSDDIVLGFQYGANDYLMKPFNKDELYARVNTLTKLKQLNVDSLNNKISLNREIDQRILLERLININRELSSEIDFIKVLNILILKIKDIINSVHGYMLIKNNDEFIYHDFENLHHDIVVSNLFDKKFLDEKEIIIYTDRPEMVIYENKDINYIIQLPVVFNDTIICHLIFESADIVTPNLTKIELIKAILSQSSIALKNALLFQEIKQGNIDLEKSNIALEQSLEELKTAEEQLIASEKRAVLSGLISGIAHEINTPLGVSITSNSHLEDSLEELINKYNSKQMDKKSLEEFLQTAKSCSTILTRNLARAADLISSFKQVSVNQSNKEKRSIILKTFLMDILLATTVSLNSKTDTEINCPENLEIESYPEILFQVFTNMIINSIKHGFNNVENGQIIIDVEESIESIIITYRDNGEGIESENSKKIFDPFFTTKRHEGSTGLGLHIVYNLVTQGLSGDIKFNNNFKGGAEFIIKIPKQHHPQY